MRNMFAIDINGDALAESKRDRTRTRFKTITVRESVVVRNDAGSTELPGPAFMPVDIDRNPILRHLSEIPPEVLRVEDYFDEPLSRLIGDLESCAKTEPKCCDALWNILHKMEPPGSVLSAEGFGDPALKGKVYALPGMLQKVEPSNRRHERT